ncbi:MAG: PilZ domain-containing protein [Sphingomicrobium sp.]|nr:PilZ domain-containing protein [Sphingomonadales bacterium]
MSDVLVYERARTLYPESLARRGHHIVYRANALNHCPGCGRSQWFVGRVSAECGFCGTAVPLAEARRDHGKPRTAEASFGPKAAPAGADQRRFPRMAARGRSLQLLIEGSPTNFALHNISAGGVMGDSLADLAPGAEVQVRFEGGILVPAIVKWSDDGLVGLAFTAPIKLDESTQKGN